MNEIQLSTRRELELMHELQQLADARAAEERRIADARIREPAEAEQEHQATASKLTKEFAARRRQLENEFANAKMAAGQEYREARAELARELAAQQTRINAEHKQLSLTIERKHKEKQWEALAVFDASKDAPQQLLDQAKKRIVTRKAQVDGLERDANTLLAMRKLTQRAEMWGGSPPANAGSSLADMGGVPASAEDRQQSTLALLHRAVIDLQAQTLPSLLLEEHRIYLWWLLAVIAMVLPALFITGFSLLGTTVGALLSGTAITAVAYLILKPRAIRQSLEQYGRIRELIDTSRQLEADALHEALLRSRQEAEAINARKEEEVRVAQEVRDQAVAEGQAKKDELLAQAEQRFHAKLADTEARHQSVLAAIEEKYPPLLDQLAKERQQAWDANESKFADRIAVSAAQHAADWQAMATRWHAGFEKITNELAAMQARCSELYGDWNQSDWQSRQAPTAVPPVVPFGHCVLPLQAVKNGVSQEPELVPPQRELFLPAWMSLAEHPRLVITADGPGREAAAEVLQLMMLRFLAAIPAGKLRFTIIDPAALGHNFASFMHLADYDEQLIGKRIWTDSRQIDERLALVADHMELVLQKYLRNDFASIHEYNAQAGEVSEPYHVVVVANVPAGLTDAALRRLKTIATAGPRCGVFTLMSIDTSIKFPTDYPLDELLNGAVHLDWSADRLHWKYPLFEKLPLQIDQLPAKDRLNDMLRHMGEQSREASKVEVPFDVVAPEPEDMWSQSCADELVIPVGRAGANQLQSLRLGKGTAQHVLISGKTGSGKSTLLHALVTNAALRFSPHEVEFYLVDFKKGVEFKTYATHQLPHARVIAIESEREFGVSVLERLDVELRHRAERFRLLGVQDLAAFRREAGEPLPRILLVIDEFQELFVADDKLAQDAALLLDRLVRQGRAFGVHVLLGSQTLAGAYSLARSTLGQMAVRIALECSEADAHLILSDDNPAARLLSRPGEAIYNDQNGMVDGNHLFQVVWLADRARQQYLTQVREHQAAVELRVEPPIVFEGNVPANPLQNDAIVTLVTDGATEAVSEPHIWLGSAVRIEPPTQLTFRRQGGTNLLIVGQDESLALGMLTTAVAALAAQLPLDTPQITILDGTRAESATRGTWQKVVAALRQGASLRGPQETASTINAMADEVARRSSDPAAERRALFLVLYDLAQLRDLRVTEEEFSFSSLTANGKPPAVDKRFREILREGPAVGVHTLIWCDSYNSLNRAVDRATMREIDYRVALQMSPVDSTSFIDSPAAGRLGEHRALFYRDDTGTITKFRPYGQPSPEWLDFLAENSATQLKAE